MKKHFNLYTLILSLLFAAFAITGCANLFDENETPITLTVTFKANYEGSTYEDDTQVVPVGKEFTLKKNTFSRPGYVFGGWSKDSTATTSSYQDGGNATFTESTILYAIWLASTSTITFNGNGGTVSGDGTTTSYTQEMTTKVPTALTPNKFKRIGYLFAGWAEDKDASEPLYKDGVTYTPSGSVTLYAIWALINDHYSIRYMDGEDDVTESATFWANTPAKTYKVDTNDTSPTYGKVIDPSSVLLPVVTDIQVTEKYFAGWYTDPNFNGSLWTKVEGVAAGDLVFYAKWADTGLYVSASGNNNNDGSQAHPFETLTYAISKIPDNSPDHEWTINIIGNVTGDTDIPSKNVKSIIIQGTTGNTTDKLTGSSGSTISVVGTTTANVVFQNITITGGHGTTIGSDTVGGGIYINNPVAKVTLKSGAVVNGNTAKKGGGVYIGDGTFKLDGGTVSSNTAHYGGGVYNKGTFELEEGAIESNTANESNDGYGGGIFNRGVINHNLSGSYVIQGNTACDMGGGVLNVANIGTFDPPVDNYGSGLKFGTGNTDNKNYKAAALDY